MAESSPEAPTVKPRARRTPEPERTLTYELAFDAGYTIRIDIPSSYKITFGPVAGAKGVERGSGGFAFRAWEAETKQRILFTQVMSFRDVSLAMTVRAVRRFGSEVWFPDNGTWVGPKRDLVERAWKDPDEMADRDPMEAPEDEKFDPNAWVPPRAKTLVGGRR